MRGYYDTVELLSMPTEEATDADHRHAWERRALAAEDEMRRARYAISGLRSLAGSLRGADTRGALFSPGTVGDMIDNEIDKSLLNEPRRNR